MQLERRRHDRLSTTREGNNRQVMGLFWKALHGFYLGRAVTRGPRYFAGYEVRRQARRAAWRATRRLR